MEKDSNIPTEQFAKCNVCDRQVIAGVDSFFSNKRKRGGTKYIPRFALKCNCSSVRLKISDMVDANKFSENKFPDAWKFERFD